VEATRSLVAVDVNTGGDTSPAAALKANLAAARALPRQLRLRGLGGQIVVDFVSMSKGHRKQLEQSLRDSFRTDPIETSLVGWTAMGLFELSRKRERTATAHLLGDD
jgi:Rne/Rng family ribonuclease